MGDLDPTYNTPAFKEFMNINELKKHVPLLEEVVVMEGVGHFVQEEKADEINQHIHDFFQRFWFPILYPYLFPLYFMCDNKWVYL